MSSATENGNSSPTSQGCGCLICVVLIYLFASVLLQGEKGTTETPQEQAQQKKAQQQERARLYRENQKRLQQQRLAQAEVQRQWQEDRQRESRRVGFLTQRANRIATELASSSTYSDLILDCRFDDDSLELTVDNVWFLLPKQIRLQHAQILAAKWLRQFENQDDRRGAGVSIQDINGNKVGGTGFLGVYVDD